MDDSKKNETQTADLPGEIWKLGGELEVLSRRFRSESSAGGDQPSDKWSPEFWRRQAFGDALARLAELAKNNFKSPETISLIAATRYIFEVSMWLRLFQADSRYCLVYYWRLLEVQKQCLLDVLQQFNRESELLDRFHAADATSQTEIARRYKSGLLRPSEVGTLVKQSRQNVDADAARAFSRYAEDAKTTGYGVQAQVIKARIIPEAEQILAAIEAEMQEYQQHIPEEVQVLAKLDWDWKVMAIHAGMEAEYDYIHSSASRLLHAEPSSLTGEPKTLSALEMAVFLRYVRVKIHDIMELAKLQPECQGQIGKASA
jgi:hypothetical protein